ncbi:MAG: Crp/Fnr family transcriptional regulator [Betaproteobacteria bacterium]|mgnify:CR=1 FL=1|jgi:CRP/FNR family transcriptional regulator, cyclic AMP receptor protein|nr:Crp/Fnr family transcriptional regulator [Betaproteobacteria bacterium]NBP43745.1 Crp/Fnr family transcriptional regulator [Betaproteobacteria bacterium]
MKSTLASAHHPIAFGHPSLEALAELGIIRRYRRHTILMEDGDTASSLMLVLEGRLRWYSLSHDARTRELTLALLGPGELVGDTSLATGKRCGTVITLTASVCAVVSSETVARQVQADPELARLLWHRAAERAEQSIQTARHALFTDTYTRLCALLRGDLALRRSASEEALTHAQMAQHIGCSREMVSRILKDLISGGYVTRLPNRCYRAVRPLPTRW